MHGQVQQLREAIREADDLRTLLENPEVDSRVKGDVLARVAQGADERVVNFVRLIAEKGRAAELPQIADELDALVAAREYPNRSQAIEAALSDALTRRARTRLAAECAKLDPAEERALAEEGLGAEAWPEY